MSYQQQQQGIVKSVVQLGCGTVNPRNCGSFTDRGNTVSFQVRPDCFLGFHNFLFNVGLLNFFPGLRNSGREEANESPSFRAYYYYYYYQQQQQQRSSSSSSGSSSSSNSSIFSNVVEYNLIKQISSVEMSRKMLLKYNILQRAFLGTHFLL